MRLLSSFCLRSLQNNSPDFILAHCQRTFASESVDSNGFLIPQEGAGGKTRHRFQIRSYSYDSLDLIKGSSIDNPGQQISCIESKWLHQAMEIVRSVIDDKHVRKNVKRDLKPSREQLLFESLLGGTCTYTKFGQLFQCLLLVSTQAGVNCA